MMSRNILLIFLVMQFAIGCDTEDSLDPRYEEYFIKYYGEEGNQIGVDVEKLADDGFIVLGNSITSGSLSSIYLLRTDNLGNEIWRQTFGGGISSTANDLAIDASGNILIAATVDETSGLSTDALILKVNQDGVKIDSAVFGYPGTNEVIASLMITSSGDIIIMGSTENVDVLKSAFDPTTDISDIYSVRTAADLQVLPDFLWRQIYGFPGRDYGQQIVEKTDGSFLFFATTDKQPPNNSQKGGDNMYLFPTNSEGSASSVELFFGTLNNESGRQISSTSDGGYVMIGSSSSPNNTNEIYMSRIRSNNDFLSAFQVSTNLNVKGVSVIEARSGGFLVLGVSNSGTAGDIYLAKVSATGGIDWSRTFGEDVNGDLASKLIQLDDGSILIVGSIELESQTKICLIKTNSQGKLMP